ncbi:bifunctional phosphopantothenoylcysteine decarboxylase/phosphopantothenate--cysteine ligase CoaBC [Devosia sp.]|uniref:bifunctional phosphopantothenoylcysteine decarboxylase/phosphopantothenate--cysteine ligase CoaBC n=1 Tax=Devosia sp. TaxID=1871048 RepID=UPI002735537C|nr:bifunctional phosphopantothenoylcysteine decarboxylase/phosphopantothenate--cysteine ligase CoaBC [Devosia sp.]MDP2778899.1 bifunctional phosphopantothenoylcysteine decarboxylase/phosphopantothenate--cysteine ligase CoaBC [Devosia sp.]
MASNILIAVSGSISAYKIADVVSELTKQGHSVQCLATPSALQFVTPLVLETLSGRPVRSALFGPGVTGTEHIDLARWADLFVVAPATANTMAKLALGLADDLMSTVALATQAPILIAPAMNTVMWDNPVVQQHAATLAGRGAQFIAPASGVLACGEVGMGKLAPVDTIVAAINDALAGPRQDLAGTTVLITAGPTTSPIDAVRYITNHSTGRMGAAMAEQALCRGASVRYVLGIDKGVVRPIPPPQAAERLTLVEVHTAEQMAAAALAFLPQVDGVIATAAVLDYRVATPASNKLKRVSQAMALDMVPSVDVLKALKQAATGQWFLGFAAETDDVEGNGLGKLQSKDLDFLFANRVAATGQTSSTGFSVSTNGGVLFARSGQATALPVMSKSDLAGRLWDLIK